MIVILFKVNNFC